MRNYLNVSFWTTLAVVALTVIAKYYSLSIEASLAAITPFLSIGALLYTALDLFVLSHNRSEINGIYRHIPMMVGALSFSLCGIILSALMYKEGLDWQIANFILFCITTLFIFHTVIATSNNGHGLSSNKSPLSEDDEVTDCFWKIIIKMIISCAIILALNYYIS